MGTLLLILTLQIFLLTNIFELKVTLKMVAPKGVPLILTPMAEFFGAFVYKSRFKIIICLQAFFRFRGNII